jgi:diguanylate cyclase (GGDEF)-like protein
VVLVGRTGLESTLRDDASIDMIRARSALEAVGEVASPPAASRELSVVVIVGQDGEPSAQAPEFLAALREANPSVRVVRIGPPAIDRALYDAILDDGVTGAALRRAIGADAEAGGRGRGVELPPAFEATPPEGPPPAEPEGEVVITPGIASVVGGEARAVEARGEGDSAILEALGGSLEGLCRAGMRLIRERSGVGDAVFEPGPGEGDAPADSTLVIGGAKRYGVLRSGTIRNAPERLASHAAWLGAWIALFERQQSLRRAAFTDPLTGAWNRRYFDGFLNAAIARARRTRQTVTVLVFDIDGFKQYNDRYGHLAGDEILIEVVRALTSSVRPSDRVCRIGGDEFAVIFDEPDGPRQAGSRPPESVYVLARRVQRQIAERRFPKLGADAPGVLTISGGLAAFPWDGHDAETLLSKADDLACHSKRQGKNAITLGPGAERLSRGESGA